MPTETAMTTRPRREAFWQWKPTSARQAHFAETQMLSALDVPYKLKVVDVDGVAINTLTAGSGGPPLVLLHGMAAAIGFWVANIPAWARHYNIYAIDLPGFGRSGRPEFEGDSVKEAEAYFIKVVDAWREKMGLECMTLLGHSMGGYLSAVYALQYPERVSHLILADPWGVPSREEPKRPIPLHWRLAAEVLTKFNPLSTIRACGPWGPDLITALRKDIGRKFAQVYPDPSLVLDYVYHMNAAEPTGESAFRTMSDNLAWAQKPLMDRLPELDPKVPVSLLYGAETWMDQAAGKKLAEFLAPRATFHIIPGAGHHIYIDNARVFNETVLQEMDRVQSAQSKGVPESTSADWAWPMGSAVRVR